jgi:hypothetical protein
MTLDDFPPPFGPAEWERLRALDPYCEIQMHRYDRALRHMAPFPGGPDRVWLVLIRPKQGRAYDMVRAMRHSLKDAALEALDEAEKHGWNKPVDARAP